MTRISQLRAQLSLRLQPKTVRGRMFGVLGPLMLFSVILKGVAVLGAVYATESVSWQNRQQQTAGNAAQTIQAFLDRAEDSLVYAGGTTDAPADRTRQFQAILDQNTSLLELVRVAANGEVLASAYQDRPLLASSFTIPQSQWFQVAQKGDLYFSSVQLAFDGEAYLILSQPASIPGEIVAARLRLAELWSVVQAIDLGENGAVYLVNTNGQIVAHSDPLVAQSSYSLVGRPEFKAMRSGGSVGWYGHYTNFAEQPVAGATANVLATGWLVVAELPIAELYRFTAGAVLLVVLVGLFTTYVVMTMARRLLQSLIFAPMSELSVGAKRIGSGDLDYRIPLRTTDEIGQVSLNFNEMADSLQVRDMHIRVQQARLEDEVAERGRAETAVRQLNADLEVRVKERTAALKESEDRYAVAVRGTNDGLWDWNLRSSVLHLSIRWKEIVGYAEAELEDRPESWLDRIHPEDASWVRKALESHLSGIADSFSAEYRLQHRDGTYRWVHSRGQALRDSAGQAYRIAGSLTDVSDRKVIEHQLVHEATHDALTGLPNRAHFRDLLQRALERTRRRQDRPLAVLFIDLDRFKVINDSLGHHSGDQLLIATAQRLAGCLRDGDVVARLGGDEFALVLADVHDQNDAGAVASRIQVAVSAPIGIDGQDVITTASIGIAVSLLGEDTPAEMLKRADLAMYQAKAHGKARHEFFDLSAQAGHMAALHLEVELRQAIELEQFVLDYQPMISIATREITGLEALVRWRHPQRGQLAPGDFIPIAEETGLILPLGEWILRTACRQAQLWHAAGWTHLRMAVNVSVAQLHDPGFVDLVRRVLRETGLPAHALELEIPETAALSELDQTLQALLALRLLGVYIALDDFGNSYATLGYLKQLPVNTLKIDRSFVARVDADRNDSAIVSAIVAMAGVLHINVVAEGVESSEQYEILAGHSCSEAQGYLICRPAGPEAITHWLQVGLVDWERAPKSGEGGQ